MAQMEHGLGKSLQRYALLTLYPISSPLQGWCTSLYKKHFCFLTKKTSIYRRCALHILPQTGSSPYGSFQIFSQNPLVPSQLSVPTVEKKIIIQPPKDILCARDTKQKPTGRTRPLWKMVIFPIRQQV